MTIQETTQLALTQLRQQKKELHEALSALDYKRILLLGEYAKQARLYADGITLEYRNRQLVVHGAIAYEDENNNLTIVYGLNRGNEPVDSIREDNLTLALNALTQPILHISE